MRRGPRAETAAGAALAPSVFRVEACRRAWSWPDPVLARRRRDSPDASQRSWPTPGRHGRRHGHGVGATGRCRSRGSGILGSALPPRPAAPCRPAKHAEAEQTGAGGEAANREGGQAGEGKQAAHVRPPADVCRSPSRLIIAEPAYTAPRPPVNGFSRPGPRNQPAPPRRSQTGSRGGALRGDRQPHGGCCRSAPARTSRRGA